MNFKIESNYLDITNYPTIEKHFEEMASKGWLINKIIVGNIFIYKRIDLEELDFSISPYEVETEFTRKTKSELAEFRSVCESVGWNYATKSFDLHIYFKEKGSEALDIQTDDEEEFRILEKIGKRYIRGYYMQIPIFLLLTYFILGGIFKDVNGLKDGLAQIIAPLFPLNILMMVMQLFHIKGFIKKNKVNIEMGKSIEYSQSKFYYNRFVLGLTYFLLFVFILYIFYASFILESKFLLIALLPALIGIAVAIIYRTIVKPSKKTLGSKKRLFALTMIIATIIPIVIMGFFMSSIIGGIDDESKPNIDGYKVISVNDFLESTVEETGNLRRQASFLIPKSYDYYSYSREIYARVQTDYSKTLTEGLAKNLVKRYRKEAEDRLRRYSEIEVYIEEGIYNEYLFKEAGITLEEFNILKEGDLKESVKNIENKLIERSVSLDSENLLNVDEAYFLNYNKTNMVLRQGKEVFYIELDNQVFSESESIKVVKDKLGLN